MSKQKELPFDTGILKGVGKNINEWFELVGDVKPFYHRENWRELIRKCQNRNAHELLQSLLKRISDNYMAGSKQLWRWTCNEGSQKMESEVGLERAIIGLKLPEWVNQVPTASGLCGPNSDRRRSIDLVRKRGDKEYDFIELKLNDQNPLYAAMEVLCYGVLYLFCRQQGISGAPGSEVLQAKVVHLCVLAPDRFYEGCDGLREFEAILSGGVQNFAKGVLHMDFRFDQFSHGFQWPTTAELKDALSSIHAVFCPSN
jgi:hypothetical protein